MNEKQFVLSVKVVIRDSGGRCLLVKRSMSSKGNPGKWDFPGGKLDPEEGFEEGLLREVSEETGLSIRLTRAVGAANSETPTKRVAYILMEGEHASGEVTLSEEHDEYAWTDIGELANADLAEQFRAFARKYAELG